MKLNKLIICADGFKMSVQANESAFCSPRVNDAQRYEAVEVGFPSLEESLLLEWADDSDNPTNTVYGWVPCDRVALVIVKHGGIVEGELPAGIPYLKADK